MYSRCQGQPRFQGMLMHDIILLRWKADSREFAAAHEELVSLARPEHTLLYESSPHDPAWPDYLDRAIRVAATMECRIVAYSGYELGSTLDEIIERIIEGRSLPGGIVIVGDRTNSPAGVIKIEASPAELRQIAQLESAARSGRAANAHARRKAHGQENKRLRVTPETRAKIRADIDRGDQSLRAIAAKYGVSRPTIDRIRAEAAKPKPAPSFYIQSPAEALDELEFGLNDTEEEVQIILPEE